MKVLTLIFFYQPHIFVGGEEWVRVLELALEHLRSQLHPKIVHFQLSLLSIEIDGGKLSLFVE